MQISLGKTLYVLVENGLSKLETIAPPTCLIIYFQDKLPTLSLQVRWGEIEEKRAAVLIEKVQQDDFSNFRLKTFWKFKHSYHNLMVTDGERL